MKVLLTRPNSRMIMAPMPLGLGYLAEAARRARGDDVTIVDGRNLRLDPSEIVARVREHGADVVGLTATIMDADETHALTAAIKAALPGVKVVLGGPYASSCSGLVARDQNVDAVVIGEGERTFVELLDVFDGGGDLDRVAGIVYREGGEIRHTEPRRPELDLDGLRPAWDLLDPPSYFQSWKRNSHNRIRKDHRVVALFSSRGCPYNCIYCHNLFGKKVRAMSPDAVLEEVDMLVDRYGVRELEFVDDNFNHDNARAKEISRRLAEREPRLHITFPNGLRGDRVDSEMLDLFQAAGVFRISYAVETASPRIQQVIRKKLDLERLEDATTSTAKRGIVTVGFFIFGFPTETVEDMEMTVDWACRSKVHVADFFYLHPYPGTPVAESAGIEFGDISYDDFSAMPVNLSAASDEDLHRMAKHAYRKFYSHPLRLARILKVVPKNTHLLLNAIITARLCFQDAVSK